MDRALLLDDSMIEAEFFSEEFFRCYRPETFEYRS